MEKIVNEMKKYGVNLPAVGAGYGEIQTAYKWLSLLDKSKCDFKTRRAAYRYMDYLSECNTLKTCIADKINVYSYIAKKMDSRENETMFSVPAIDRKAWNSTIEKKLIRIVTEHFKPASVGLCVRVKHEKEYHNFELYLESKNYFSSDNKYMRIYIINVWGKDYELLFDVPEGKVRPVFHGAVANAQMTNNLFSLEKKIEALKYALMYGKGIINQINAYMDIVYRLYSSLPFEYRKVYGNKIKKYSF